MISILVEQLQNLHQVATRFFYFIFDLRAERLSWNWIYLLNKGPTQETQPQKLKLPRCLLKILPLFPFLFFTNILDDVTHT